MNYDPYLTCDGKCYWCWECSETQHIDLNNVMRKGHGCDSVNVSKKDNALDKPKSFLKFKKC